MNLKRGGEALGQFPYDAILGKLKSELDGLIANRQLSIALVDGQDVRNHEAAQRRNAIIAEEKLAGYLLDIAHRRGGSKAKLLLFARLRGTNAGIRLADDLRQRAPHGRGRRTTGYDLGQCDTKLSHL